MCNLYRMTATVDEMRRVFGGFDGDRDNLPSFSEIYPITKPQCSVGTVSDLSLR